MAQAEKIPNIDFLGKCYDVVAVNPLNLGGSSKNQNAVDVDASGEKVQVTPDGSWTIPIGVNHTAPFSMSYESQSSVISSAYDFQQEFKKSVEVEAGVEGAFEFSGSASVTDIERETQTRQNSFVYSRAYQEDHQLALDLLNEKAPLSVTSPFRDAVDALDARPSEESDWIDQYRSILSRFGTHFTKEIVLGGLAFQRTKGSSKTYLKSRSTEEDFKAKAGVEIEKVKLGLSGAAARTEADKVDAQFALERTMLEFRGGLGDPKEINSAWIESLRERPTIVKASLEPLGSLLISRLFPNETQAILDIKRMRLELATRSWILEKGSPGCITPPLCYGEPLIFTFGDQSTSAALSDNAGTNLLFERNRPETALGLASAAVCLESVDGGSARKGCPILAGDRVKFRVLDKASYLSIPTQYPRTLSFSEFAVLHNGDNPNAPGRIGEYFLETDPIQFITGTPAPANFLGVWPSPPLLVANTASNRQFFNLRRCETPGSP
jgi:hypothetical protein